jgi:ABC-type multidrug transport system fused ATPase/permease subunit
LDLESGDVIDSLVQTEFSKCTVITVAHKLGPLVGYDKIVVLEDGVVVETGNPAELLANPASTFKKLFDGVRGQTEETQAMD